MRRLMRSKEYPTGYDAIRHRLKWGDSRASHAGDQHRPDHSPIQPITSPRAREESMPDLGEFAALFVVLFLTMYW